VLFACKHINLRDGATCYVHCWDSQKHPLCLLTREPQLLWRQLNQDGLHAQDALLNDALYLRMVWWLRMMNWYGCGRKRDLSFLRQYKSIRLVELRKNAKTVMIAGFRAEILKSHFPNIRRAAIQSNVTGTYPELFHSSSHITPYTCKYHFNIILPSTFRSS